MRFILRAVVSLPVLFVAGSVAVASGTSSKKARPCDADFELNVVVRAAEGSDSTPVGFKLHFDHMKKKGTASKLERDLHGEFDESACRNWQAKYWPLVDQLILENDRSERAAMKCQNMASIKYRVGGASQDAVVCLSDARADNVTLAFRKFFDGSDHLMAR